MKQSRKTIRGARITRIVSALMLVAVLVGGFVVVNNDVTLRTATFTPTVGLVNEDVAAELNGTEYTFGARFVDRISKDSEYNWTVLSRSVAEKAYADGSVDAVIYLPQSFSSDILSLQDLDPTKATIEYKLRHQITEQADRLLDNKITGIVAGFNQGVVKMYYSSIADNIAEADGQMNAALVNQEALISALTTEVQAPFSGTMPNFESLVAGAKSLKDVSSATVEAQNTFAEAATETLTKTGESFAGKLPEIDEYAKRQKEIAQVNVTNSNRGISNQATTDRHFYGNQYDTLQTNVLCALSGLDREESAEPCKQKDGTIRPHFLGQFQQFESDLTQYQTEYDATVRLLQGQLPAVRVTLDESIDNLRVLLAEIDPPEETEPAPGTPEPPTTTEPPAVAPELVQQLIEDIDELERARASLTSDDLRAPDFASQITGLNDWYATTHSMVKGAELGSSAVTSIEVSDWGSYDPDNVKVYTDSSDMLERSLTDMVQQAAESNSKIGAGQSTIPDNEKLFDALLQNANGTFDGAQSVQQGVDDLVTAGGLKLTENQTFTRNFSTVLANTRTPGVDTSKIHDFFAAPIKAENITPARATAADTFDMKWVYMFGGGLLAGALGMLFAGTFRTRNTEE